MKNPRARAIWRAIAAVALALGGATRNAQGLELEDRAAVPPVSSPPEVVEKIVEIARLQRGGAIADLGCGDGRIVRAAVRRGASRGVCVEISIAMLKEAKRLASEDGVLRKLRLVRMDLRSFVAREANVSGLDVVVMYLSPGLNAEVAPMLRRHLRPGALVISHQYAIEGWTPGEVLAVPMATQGRTSKLYVYRMP